jgi:hypothetical protein
MKIVRVNAGAGKTDSKWKILQDARASHPKAAADERCSSGSATLRHAIWKSSARYTCGSTAANARPRPCFMASLVTVQRLTVNVLFITGE